MKNLVLAFCMLISMCLNAQDDHLERTRDFDQFSGIIKEYYDGLFEKLFQDLSPQPMARYLVIPSNTPEYTLSLEKFGEKYLLHYHICAENYWFAIFPKKVEVIKSSIVIKEDLALGIQKLFDTATSRLAKPNYNDIQKGETSYYFSVYKEPRGLITGKKYSPPANTKMMDLVTLCEKYIKCVRKKGKGQDLLLKETGLMISRLGQ